jgi:hypothetical protein
LNETIEKLEQKCDDITKQYEDVKRMLEQERRKNEKIQESSSGNHSESQKVKALASSSIPVDNGHLLGGSSSSSSNIVSHECSSRHNSGSASEPENEEVSVATARNKNLHSIC